PPNRRSGFARVRRPSAAILRVRHLLQPFDDLAVLDLLDGDMAHRRGGRGPVPVFLARREPDDVTGPYLLDGAALALHAPGARGDDQGLPERMRVPGGA